MVERANEATMNFRNYFGSHRIKTAAEHTKESYFHPADGISIKIRNKWGKIITKETLIREKFHDAYGKAYDKITGQKQFEITIYLCPQTPISITLLQIRTVFNAAPILRLSATHQSAIPL